MTARTPGHEPVSRRTRPAKAALSADAVVSAALAVLDAEGLSAVTMRRVAQALDTGPASLYVYVANRDELLELVYDRVLGEIALPPARPIGTPVPEWRPALTTLIRDAITVLGRHRGIATVALGEVRTGPNALALAESILALLSGSGIDDRTRAFALDLIGLHITAAAVEESHYYEKGLTGMTEEHAVAEMDAAFASRTTAAHPHLTAIHHTLTEGSGDERDTWTIATLLNGIVSTPATP
jgi:AcrR family transcriptional regulator